MVEMVGIASLFQRSRGILLEAVPQNSRSIPLILKPIKNYQREADNFFIGGDGGN